MTDKNGDERKVAEAFEMGGRMAIAAMVGFLIGCPEGLMYSRDFLLLVLAELNASLRSKEKDG